MALDTFKNFAKGTLSAGIASGATSLTLTTGHGARFPVAPFNAVIWNSTDYSSSSDAIYAGQAEIVRVTAIASDTLTITRGQEGTTAVNLNTSGKTYKIAQTITAKTFNADVPALAADSRTYGVGDGTTVLVAGSAQRITMPRSGTISGWYVEGDVSGSVSFDIKKGTPSGGAVSLSSIVASAPPTLSSAQVASSTTLTGWTTTFAAGDVFEFSVTGTPASVKRASLTISYN